MKKILSLTERPEYTELERKRGEAASVQDVSFGYSRKDVFSKEDWPEFQVP